MPNAHLTGAAAALERGDRSIALQALLEAWRRCRAAELAMLIDVVSEDAARSVPRIDPADKRNYDRAWAALESKHRVIDVEHLLPGLWSGAKGGIPLRLRALLARGPDPRVGRGMLRMIADPPMTASSNFSTWTLLFDALPSYVDTSMSAMLNERARAHGGTSQFWPRLTRWIESTLPNLPNPAKLPAAVAEQVSSLLARATELAKGPPGEVVGAAPVMVTAAAAADVSSALAAARQRIEASDLDGALAALQLFWAERRATGVAALIDRLGALVDAGRPALIAGTPRQTHAAWMKAAVDPPAAAIGRLLEALPDQRLADVEESLAAMVRWHPDPRIARAMFGFIDDYRIGGRSVFWSCVYDLLRIHADPRINARFVERCTRLEQTAPFDRIAAERAGMRRVREQVMAAFDAATELEERERRLVAEMDERVAALAAEQRAASDATADMIAGFVETIVACPDDDEPRMVFADWLTERGDPMGEYIALSVALARGKKVKVRLRKHETEHRKRLIGALGGLIGGNYDIELGRGFLRKLRINPSNAKLDRSAAELDELFGDWRWRLIEELDLGWDPKQAGVVLARAQLDSVRRLEGVPIGQLLSLRAPIFAEWIELVHRNDMASGVAEPVNWDAFCARAHELLPKLKVVKYTAWTAEGLPPAPFFDCKLAHQLDELSAGDERTAAIPKLHLWIQRLYETRCEIPHVSLVSAPIACTLRLAPSKKRVMKLAFSSSLQPFHAEWPLTLAILSAISGAPLAETTCSFAFPTGDPRQPALLEALAHLSPTIIA